jgi:hypothetical protein
MYEQFNDPEFSVFGPSFAISEMPHVPGQVGALGVFEEDGQASTTVKIEREGSVLKIIDPTPRGAPGQTLGDRGRDLVPFEMDHFEINDAVMADEVQGVRELGSADAAETLQGRIEKKQADHARSMDLTLEHSRVGAIKGLVTSGSGTTLHDLYARFEISVPAAVDTGIVDGTAVSGLDALLEEQVRFGIEDELDEAYDHIHVMTGRKFHAWLWGQGEVREAFLGYEGAARLLNGVPPVFTFGDMIFERYRMGKKSRTAHGGVSFIDDAEARAFPVGVPGLFLTRYGPADYNETVNTIGLPRYTKVTPQPKGKGTDVDSQSNFINLCTRPGALRRLRAQAAE